jgi:hypothetical protein
MIGVQAARLLQGALVTAGASEGVRVVVGVPSAAVVTLVGVSGAGVCLGRAGLPNQLSSNAT